jgi:hypothetical protein
MYKYKYVDRYIINIYVVYLPVVVGITEMSSLSIYETPKHNVEDFQNKHFHFSRPNWFHLEKGSVAFVGGGFLIQIACYLISRLFW